MTLARVAVGLVLLGGLAAAALAAPPLAPQQLLDQMSARFTGVNDYEVVIDSVAREGNNEERIRYRFAWKRPSLIRLRTLSGPDKDGELCCTKAGKIRGRKNSGLIKVFAVSMDRDDKRLRDAEGVPVWQMDAGSTIHRLKTKLNTPGVQASVTGPDRPNGLYQLSLRGASGAMAGIAENYWIDSQSLWITRMERLKNGALSESRAYSALRVNPGFTDQYFEF